MDYGWDLLGELRRRRSRRSLKTSEVAYTVTFMDINVILRRLRAPRCALPG